jgi:two-component system sensor histidine kinase SenX3
VGWAFVIGVAAGALAGIGGAFWWVRRTLPPPRPDPAVHRVSAKGLGRRTVDALRVGVMVLDRGDRPVLANPAVRELGLVRAGGEDDGRQPGPSMAPHAVARNLAAQARRTGAPREIELDLPRGLGLEAVGVYIRAVCLDDEYVAIEAADLTEARRLAKVRRDFVANVSHELKTPVGALHLLAEALLEATDPDTERGTGPDARAARRFAERIQHESVRMARLVTELIELSRLQGADPLPALEPVSVDRIVAEVLDRTRTGASAKNIQVGFAGMRGLTVYGSESQLATALGNLVENAIAYSPDAPAEQPPGRVTVTAHGESGAIEISVIDEGIGIEAADLDRIFERFYRADRARSRATGGTGLGLAIVKHIVTNHGGRITVSSTPGVGSTFTLRLPARPPDAATPPPATSMIGADPAPAGQLGKGLM